MPVMEWSKSFELGVEEFDRHHRQLVDLLNTTYDRFTGGAEHNDLETVLDELSGYAAYHFAAEELWMGVNGFPGLPKQRTEHEKFCNRVSEIQHDFRNGNGNLSLEVLSFLVGWLTNHILVSDAEYGLFARGLSQQGEQH